MKKNKLSTYFIFISIFTVVTLFMLIVQRSYSNLVGPLKKIDSSRFLSPINPQLDLEVISNIEKRENTP